MENMVANEGFVRGLRTEAQRLSEGLARYRLNGQVALPGVGRELTTRDVVLLAAARGEGTRAEILSRAQMSTSAGARAFAQLVRDRVIIRTNAAVVIHLRSFRQAPAGADVELHGVVSYVGNSHPRKRHVYLVLDDGRRVKVFCYGAEAVTAAALPVGARVQVQGIKLQPGRMAHVKAVTVDREEAL